MKGKKCKAGPRLTPADISQQRVSQIQEGGQQGDITASLHCSSKYWVAIRWEEGKRLSNTQKLTPRDTSLQPGNKKRFNFFYTPISAKVTEKSPEDCLGKQEVSGEVINQHSPVISETVPWALRELCSGSATTFPEVTSFGGLNKCCSPQLFIY